MLTNLVALTSTSSQVTADQLQAVAAAINKQVQRDFGPAWGLQMSVQAFTDPTKIPADYWPVTVQDTLDAPGAAGYHTDDNGQPYSLVMYEEDWSVTASHETIEMGGDPFGNRLVAVTLAGKRVRLLVELADPCEEMTYAIDQVVVSDFLLPGYYQTAGTKDDFLGMLKGPLSMGQGGYFSYLDDQNNWWQETWFDGTAPVTVNLGPDTARPRNMSLRSYIDRLTKGRSAKK